MTSVNNKWLEMLDRASVRKIFYITPQNVQTLVGHQNEN